MLTSGSRLGPYEILAPLGAGGMGEVFRARDARIDRTVALKVLPAEWSHDPERLRRFEQEARAAGSLSHPNILTLYDLGAEGEVRFIVTELLEGETLRDRLLAGGLPVRKAVDIAGQIARGLAAAHEQGIIHRDLKPENVFLMRDGRVKILDFGLVRLAEPSGGTGSAASDSETRIATQAGVVVGTPGYMSPEQARGQSVDQRTDIFSLGAVLYEMLSGRRAFGGSTAVDAISSVVRDDPPPLSGPQVSPALARVVQHCLEKQTGERYQSARDVAFALEAVSSGSGVAAEPAHAGSARRGWMAPALIGLTAAALGAAGMSLVRRPAPAGEGPTLRYEAYSGLDSAPAVSPDGKTMAFTSTRDGRSRIWLKQLVGSSEAPLTDGNDSYARFHPDGGAVLFIRREGGHNSVFRQGLLGGDPRRLVTDADEADWSPDGRRLALVRRKREGSNAGSVVLVANADGSDLRELATLSGALTLPRWSPDGQTIASVEYGLQSGNLRHLVLVSVGDGRTRRIESALGRRRLSSPAWMADGEHIAYLQAESVTADTSGSAARIFLQDITSGATRLLLWSPMSAETLEVIADGSLIWDGMSPRANLQLSGIGAASDPARTRWLTRGQSNDRQPVFSPDGQWIVFSSNRSGNLDLWALSPQTGEIRRLTDDAADDWDPAMTRDNRLLWSSSRGGHFEIWTANFDGSEARQVSQDGIDAENPTATPDGWVVYNSANPQKHGLWKVKLDGSGATRLVEGNFLVPDTSPDGQYVAATAQSQTAQVRIQVFRVADGAKVPFEIVLPSEELTFGVGRTRWMPDSRHLAFVGLDARGVRGVFVQDVVPGRDTTDTRRPLGAFNSEARTESFGISPDAAQLVATETDLLRTILRADGVAGIVRPVPAK